MLDIATIRESPKIVKASLKKRNLPEKQVDEVLKLDEEWRKLKGDADSLRAKRNKISEEINAAKKAGGDVKKIIKEAQEVPQKVAKIEERVQKIRQELDNILNNMPNILHESVPAGKTAEDNPVVRKFGKPRKFDFELKGHGELAEQNNWADFKRAAKNAGAGFVYLKGQLAVLDIALQRFAVDMMIKNGFTLVEPPFLLNKDAYSAVTPLKDFENVMYKIENEEMYLIATSEHPLAALHMNEVLKDEELPVTVCGISPCFRKEIGSHGVDTRGFFRMHQFNKIEQVVLCKPEESWKWFEKMQKITESIFQELEIPYRIIEICSGDLSPKNAKQYDIEGWFPRQGKYAELGSCSNCTTYQAARANIRYQKKDGTREYVHTLNNTATATSRAMVAILENHQNKDGTVDIPKALQKYTGFKKMK